MRVLVAGATGAIGRRLVPLLTGSGHHVVAMTRQVDRATHLRAMGAEVEIVDVYDRDRVADVVNGVKPDVVMHQLTDLGTGSSTANARLRDVGTGNLVAAGRAAGVRRIVSQSIAWAYEPGVEPAKETTPLDFAAAEPRATTVSGVVALEQASATMPEWVCLRYGTLYGPGTWYGRDGDVARQLRRGELSTGPSVTSFVHVDDAAAAAVAALDWPSGVVNICDDEPATADVWVPEFAAALGLTPTTVRGPVETWARGADNDLARHRRGWTPSFPSWRAGFHASIRQLNDE